MTLWFVLLLEQPCSPSFTQLHNYTTTNRIIIGTGMLSKAVAIVHTFNVLLITVRDGVIVNSVHSAVGRLLQ